jgi:Rrf2 family protein
MRKDSRLSRMLHVLLHMGRHDRPFTSEQIARMLETNPVVVRRTMAGLRRAGYVRSVKGHGGGWTMVRSLGDITLLDVHKAVGGMRIFAIGNRHDDPSCGVERVVNAALDDALREAESMLLEKLGTVVLAELARDLDADCESRAGKPGALPRKPSLRCLA